jgi:hypothetical protein
MRKLSNQQQQIVVTAKAAGGIGVHSSELRRAGIGNPSQRVIELEELGYVF